MIVSEQQAEGVTVTRIGTAVVVRLSGHVGDPMGAQLITAVREVELLVLQRVVVDLADVLSIDGAGLDFLATLHGRWQVRLLNTPAALRRALPRRTGVTTAGVERPDPITLSGS